MPAIKTTGGDKMNQPAASRVALLVVKGGV
jgi:hypothetical protein